MDVLSCELLNSLMDFLLSGKPHHWGFFGNKNIKIFKFRWGGGPNKWFASGTPAAGHIIHSQPRGLQTPWGGEMERTGDGEEREGRGGEMEKPTTRHNLLRISIWADHGLDVEDLGRGVVGPAPGRAEEHHVGAQAGRQRHEVPAQEVDVLGHAVHLCVVPRQPQLLGIDVDGDHCP